MSERNPWFDPPSCRPSPASGRAPVHRAARPSAGPEQPVDATSPSTSPWRVRPLGRNRWLLVREGVPIAELGVLSTIEWWVCPAGEALPWAETYGDRGAACRAVIVWWLHTHPFDRE